MRKIMFSFHLLYLIPLVSLVTLVSIRRIVIILKCYLVQYKKKYIYIYNVKWRNRERGR